AGAVVGLVPPVGCWPPQAASSGMIRASSAARARALSLRRVAIAITSALQPCRFVHPRARLRTPGPGIQPFGRPPHVAERLADRIQGCAKTARRVYRMGAWAVKSQDKGHGVLHGAA